MSTSDAAQPEPAIFPQEPPEVKKGAVGAIDPAQTRGLRKLPQDVTSTLSKADELVLRISKLIKTSAGLGAALSTLNYSLYLAAYLHAQAPSRAAVIAYISRLVGRAPLKVPPAAAASSSVLTPLGSFISDTRTTLRLTGLIPLYIWLKTLLAKKSGDMDPALHRVALLQCTAYIGFQALENTYHLAGKGIVPMQVIQQRGGINKWVAWSCRAWLVGVASDFLRLWREAQIEQRTRGSKTAAEKEAADRKWWNEFMVAAYWMPVAVHYSLYPDGIKGMNMGLIGALGLMAGLTNFRAQWAATA